VTSDGGERWRVDARVAARLLELGKAGVGGFHARDGDELVRTPDEPDLERWLAANPSPIAWRRAAAMIASLADAAAACEKASLFPGALDVRVRGDVLELRADALVHAMVGAAVHEPAPKWLPPEARAADNATNRYAIGIVAYRLVTGEHPFAGRGLRAGLDDQAVRGAAPFAPELAATLPPGLQSLCLRLLDPDPAKRPASAAAIARAFRELDDRAPALEVGSYPVAPVATSSPKATSRTPRNVARPRSGAVRALVALTPIAAAIGIAAWAISAIGSTSRDVKSAAVAAPLASARKLADCASCHPRQAAEWSRSVMAHAIGSPLFQALEMLIEEQVGRDRDCPHGAGILRGAGIDPCRNRRTGLAVTGSGGALWCVNCHAPGENLAAAMPAWDAHAFDARSRQPLRDLLPPATMEGISCAACHQMTGPAHPGSLYQGNPSWTSPDTGATFAQRPEDERGLFGIANSGYLIDPRALVSFGDPVRTGAHRGARTAYQRSSEFCGACHDVRLFGTDAIGGAERGEHFKRLRNAYSEWAAWAAGERARGRTPASCQDCHMSLYPGVCVPSPSAVGISAASLGCPAGTVMSPRAPGSYATGRSATDSAASRIATHYFSGVDVPLARGFDPRAVDDATLDVAGIPLGARQRRDLLLASAMKLTLDAPRADGDRLEIPIVVENVGAGHRVPAGFSQEREIWIHLRVTDGRGRIVYEVGKVDHGDEDLHDKTFLRVTTTDARRDRLGRPQGLFGADVADGPDAPAWTAFGEPGAFRGRGLVNFQNGFMRCVVCIGTIDASGRCQARPGQETRRADRYADGNYDPDTGECRSNLAGAAAFFETYFPIGALDASRGIVKGPDAIVDTRSLPPGQPARYTYELSAPGAVGPYTVEATLEFRAFPPYLVRAFVDYEAAQASAGLRPSGPLVDAAALERLDIVHLATARAVIR
jgi:hypothetical protein